jgi:hypothetical protein
MLVKYPAGSCGRKNDASCEEGCGINASETNATLGGGRDWNARKPAPEYGELVQRLPTVDDAMK